MNNNLKHQNITQKIIGAAFEVHKFMGNGFQEVIYQRALAIEMRKAGLEFAREIEQDIFYKDFQEPIGTRRADFVVAGEVLVELKAISVMEDVHDVRGTDIKLLEGVSLRNRLITQFRGKKFGNQKTDSHTTQSRIQRQTAAIEQPLQSASSV